MAETPTIEIPMTAADRRRVRRVVVAPDGVEFLLQLPTGTVLQPGQVLHRSDERAYVVAATAEDVVVARPRSLAEAARVGHLVGNLHRDIEVDGDEVIALADAALVERLRRVDVPFTQERRAFRGRAAGEHAH